MPRAAASIKEPSPNGFGVISAQVNCFAAGASVAAGAAGTSVAAGAWAAGGWVAAGAWVATGVAAGVQPDITNTRMAMRAMEIRILFFMISSSLMNIG
jgi:hypothetical protein